MILDKVVEFKFLKVGPYLLDQEADQKQVTKDNKIQDWVIMVMVQTQVISARQTRTISVLIRIVWLFQKIQLSLTVNFADRSYQTVVFIKLTVSIIKDQDQPKTTILINQIWLEDSQILTTIWEEALIKTRTNLLTTISRDSSKVLWILIKPKIVRVSDNLKSLRQVVAWISCQNTTPMHLL